MTNSPAPTYRSGHSNVPQDEVRAHTLVVFVEDRPGSVDRVVGLFRRRRANLQSLTLGRTERAEEMRIAAVVTDSEVAVEHLVEQLRKIFDVRKVESPGAQETITHELALVKVVQKKGDFADLSEFAQRSGAYIVDVAQDTVTFEVTGSSEKIDQFIEQMQQYGIREVARSGGVMLAR